MLAHVLTSNLVIRSHYRKGFLKQYVRDRFLLRTEPATNDIFTDYAIRKGVENLPELRKKLVAIIDRSAFTLDPADEAHSDENVHYE